MTILKRNDSCKRKMIFKHYRQIKAEIYLIMKQWIRQQTGYNKFDCNIKRRVV